MISALKFSFLTITCSPFIINYPETVNCHNFLFVSTFVGDFGRELSCKREARLKLENKRRKLRWDGDGMGVAATLPELSEWTLQMRMCSTNIKFC